MQCCKMCACVDFYHRFFRTARDSHTIMNKIFINEYEWMTKRFTLYNNCEQRKRRRRRQQQYRVVRPTRIVEATTQPSGNHFSNGGGACDDDAWRTCCCRSRCKMMLIITNREKCARHESNVTFKHISSHVCATNTSAENTKNGSGEREKKIYVQKHSIDKSFAAFTPANHPPPLHTRRIYRTNRYFINVIVMELICFWWQRSTWSQHAHLLSWTRSLLVLRLLFSWGSRESHSETEFGVNWWHTNVSNQCGNWMRIRYVGLSLGVCVFVCVSNCACIERWHFYYYIVSAGHDHLNYVNAILFSIYIHSEWEEVKQKTTLRNRGREKKMIFTRKYQNRVHVTDIDRAAFSAPRYARHSPLPLPYCRCCENAMTFFFLASRSRAYFHAFNIYSVWALSRICLFNVTFNIHRNGNDFYAHKTRTPKWNEMKKNMNWNA